MSLSKEEIGFKLKKLRMKTGMTQREAAEALGRRQQIIGHWETGYAQPDLNTFFSLCSLYHADINQAFQCGDKSEQSFTAAEEQLIFAYRMATQEEQSIIQMILKKYENGSALSVLNSLYQTPTDRWLPERGEEP